MTMRWEDERYVRLYTRDTTDWLCLSFVAQALFCLLLRKVDRAGILELGKHGKRGVAVAIGHPGDWPQLETALEELLNDGCVRIEGPILVVPNFIEAQEAVQSDAQRKRAQRERARAGVTGTWDEESRNVTECHESGQKVTRGHAESRAVTPSLAVPSQAQPSEPVAADGGPDERWSLYRRAVADRLAKPVDWFRLAAADRAPAARAALDAELVRLGVDRAADIVAERARREGVKRWLSYYTGLLSEATRVETAPAPSEPLPAPDPAFLDAHPGSREVWAEYERTARSKATSDADLARLLKTSLFLFTNAYTEAA